MVSAQGMLREALESLGRGASGAMRRSSVTQVVDLTPAIHRPVPAGDTSSSILRRQLTPKLGKGDGIDEGKLRAQCQAVAVSMGQTGGPVASVASPAPAATLPAAGTVVRDCRSGDVEYGPKRHGVTDGARVAEVLCGGRVT